MPLDLNSLKTAARANRRSVLSTGRTAQDISRETFRIKALLVGDSGTGKSTSAITIPGRKLVFECDRRAESLAGFPDIEIIDVSSWADLTQGLEELWELAHEGSFPYAAVIFDSLTSMGRFAMEWALNLTDSKGVLTPRGLGGVPAQQHYYPQMHALSQLVLSAIPLPCHIVLTGHLDLYEDKVLHTIDLYPKVTGKIRTEVSSWFNETYLCCRKGEKYFWKTAPFQRYTFLKSALNKLNKYWSDEVVVDFASPPTGFEHVLNLRFGKEGTNGR